MSLGGVWLGLGSNLGDRERRMALALEALEREGVPILRVSPLYETAPRDVLDQPPFLNAVAETGPTLEPTALLAAALHVETSLGRVRDVAKGPRTIDIDILLYLDRVVNTAGLHIPHPRLAGRRFVLEPLAALAPDLVHPILGCTIAALLDAVRDQRVERLQTGIPMRHSP